MIPTLRLVITTLVAVLTLPIGVTGAVTSQNLAPTDATAPASNDVPGDVPNEVPNDIPNDFMDLERDLSQCISSNPLPGCGREPTSPGDRGGWQQFLLFGIMMSGIGIIFWRVARSIRARDRVLPTSDTEEAKT